MSLTQQIAKHFRDLHTGKNWTCSNLQDNLAGVTWQQATTQVHGFNTIATLVYHTQYYVTAALEVLNGRPLNSSDEESFGHPPITSREEWDQFVEKTFAQAETFAAALEQLPEETLWDTFSDEKYGNYYRNIHGIIEHTHYHLGQIALIRKIVQNEARP